jgi:hypothetical protein
MSALWVRTVAERRCKSRTRGTANTQRVASMKGAEAREKGHHSTHDKLKATTRNTVAGQNANLQHDHDTVLGAR